MKANVKITNISTFNTDAGKRENQPMVEITLEIRKGGAGPPKEIKFTEMLSNLGGTDPIQIADYLAAIIEDYVRTALKGQQALGPDKKWVLQDQLIGRQYTFDI